MALEVRTRVDAAREDTVFEVHENGKLLFRHLLDATDLDAHILNLAKCRAQMVDQVPPSLEEGSRLETIVNPAWFIQAPENDPPEGRAMLVRHPGFGWLGFVFPHKVAAMIAELLTRRLKNSAAN